jgi:AraC-like DNA-binding protein
MPNVFMESEINLLLYAFFPHKRRFDFDEEQLDFEVLFVCDNGRFEYAVGDIEEGIAGKGDAIFCPAGKPLRRRVLEPVSLHVLRYSFEKPADKTPAGKLRIDDFDRLRTDFNMIQKFSLITRFTPYERHYLLDVIFTLFAQLGLLTDIPCRDCDDTDIASAINEMKRTLSEKITVKALAAQYGLTPVAFIRRFNKAVGKNPIDYLITLRMQAAMKLLGETKKPLSEIAASCGYSNEYYFSNSFKRFTGKSPTEFRRSAKL